MIRALWGLLLTAPFAAADALVVTRAMKATTILEVFVGADEVRVELEIAAADVEAFSNLLPRKGDTPEALFKRLGLFFKADLVLSADGEALVGRVEGLQARRRVRRDEITGEPAGESDETVLFLRLRYPLAGAPRTFAIKPPTGANIGFVVYHEGVAMNDFRYLGGEQVADLDWTDPFFSRFRSRNLRRRYDSPLNAFLYVDHFEVRKEIICRPRDLGIETGTVIKAAERDEIKRRVVAFLEGKNPVTVDGKPARGELDRIHFIRRTLKTTGVIPVDEDIPAVSAILGVIYVYPVVGLPKKVSMRWEVFTPRVGSVPAVATDEAGGMPSLLTPDDPVLVWQNFLKNPSSAEPAVIPPPRPRSWLFVWCALALVAVGLVTRRRVGIIAGSVGAALFLAVWVLESPSPVPEKAEAEQVVGGLLRNLYRAFDYRGESAIYDTLQRSVDGDLLRRIYIETRRALELANQGGARAKVKQVEIESTEELSALDDGPGFAVDCTWKVAGAVGHWGHIHMRRNRYEARLVIRPVDGVWKITDLEILDERRL